MSEEQMRRMIDPDETRQAARGLVEMAKALRGATPTDPEAVERLAERLDGAECKAGCGSMTVCMCAYAADCVETMLALSAENAALRAEVERLRDSVEAALQRYEVSGNRTVLLDSLNAALTSPSPRHTSR